MPPCFARIFDHLLRLFLPAPGRHRGNEVRPSISRGDEPTIPLPRVARVDASPTLTGADVALVRPYVVASELRRKEERQQWQRRRALWLAVHGVDIGPRRIHGVEVTV
ncbi:hypothetical protein [Streptomyces violens]|uniref:hypothetical protein n=1 Tax=Streptomyces violens TaxID=66377 RepID=UPI0004BEF199|nr:hypothetical protein [Streptomyces violens]